MLISLYRYLNLVTKERRSTMPPQFYGGILADQMGLGKTLQILALIATDLEGSNQAIYPVLATPGFGLTRSQTTLVILPISCRLAPFESYAYRLTRTLVLQTWSDQLQWFVRHLSDMFEQGLTCIGTSNVALLNGISFMGAGERWK
jgi:hypothetical protein